MVNLTADPAGLTSYKVSFLSGARPWNVRSVAGCYPDQVKHAITTTQSRLVQSKNAPCHCMDIYDGENLRGKPRLGFG